VDLDVEPYQKVEGKIQSIIGENGVRQPYKPTSQTNL
jgi:hypothetical protein